MKRSWAVACAAAALLGCTGGGAMDAGTGGGAGGGTGGGGGAATVATVTVSPTTLMLHVGETQQLSAVAKDAAGNTLSGQSVTWTSSAPTVLSVDANGLASALASGSADVTATAGGVTSAAVPATVLPVGNVVGPAGGTLSFDSGKVVMVFPAGAVTTDTAITVTASTVTPPSYPKVLPATRYDFGPEGITFAQPVAVTVTYDPQEVPAGARAEWLQLAKLIGPSWVPVASQVDTTAHTVTGQVTGFSPWAITAFPGQLKRLRFPDNAAQTRFGLSALTVDAQGHVIVTGSTQDPIDAVTPIAGGTDAFVAVYGLALSSSWVKQLGSDGVDSPRAVAATPTGVIGIAGTTSGAWTGTAPSTGTDAFVTTLTPDGATRAGWPVQNDVLTFDDVHGLLANAQEQFLLLADAAGSPALRCALTTFESAGMPTGTVAVGFGAPGTIVQSGAAVASSSVGVYVMAQTQPLSTVNSEWTGWALAGLDTTGSPLAGYPMHFGDTMTGAPLSMTSDALGNVYVAAFSETTADVVRLTSFNATGALRSGFPVEFNAGSNGTIKSMAVDAVGNVYLGGTTEGDVDGTNAGGTDVFVTSYSPAGALRSGWPLQFGTAGDDRLVNLAISTDGEVVLAGQLDNNSTSTEGADWVLVRLLAN